MEVESASSDVGERDAKRLKGLLGSETLSLGMAIHHDNGGAQSANPRFDGTSQHRLISSDSKLMPPPVSIPKRKVKEIPSFSHFGRSFYDPKPDKDRVVRTRFGFVVGHPVQWCKCDDDISEGMWGLVKGFTTEHVRVAFAHGSWKFDPGSLFCIGKVKFVDGWEVGDLVKLTNGSIGEILGYCPTSMKIRVKTCDKIATYSSLQLLHIKRNDKFGLAEGDVVKWSGADTDIPQGTEGRVLGFTSEAVCVDFKKGAWAFQISELFHVGQSRFGYMLGDSVQWLEADEDVLLGVRGQVVGFIPHRQLVSVQFPIGQFNFLPSKLVRVNGSVIFGFSTGDVVLWRSADEDIPRGTLGVVTGFTCEHVRASFRQRTWNFVPQVLQKRLT